MWREGRIRMCLGGRDITKKLATSKHVKEDERMVTQEGSNTHKRH